MALLYSKFVFIFLSTGLILLTEHVTETTHSSLGCSRQWNLNYYNSTIDNYTVVVEPDQVYNLRSPLLDKLTYPLSSLFTWYVRTSDSNSVSMMIYLLFMKTEGYCDVVRLGIDDNPIDVTEGPYPRHDVAYWSGGFDYAYDYNTNKQIFIATHYAEGKYAVVQFNTDAYYADTGFIIRVLPLLDSRFELESGTYMAKYTAEYTLQQLELKPGPLHEEVQQTRLAIQAEDPSRRVMVNVIFMNIEHQNDCRLNYIRIFDGSSEKPLLLEACRDMNSTTQPMQAVSVSNKLIIKYRCTTKQLFDVRQRIYTASPCAILNFEMYKPEDYDDHLFDTDDYTEYYTTVSTGPVEFNGQYLRFSVKALSGISFLFQTDKYEDYKETAVLSIFSSSTQFKQITLGHKLHGESEKSDYLSDGSREFVNQNEFKNYWLAIDRNKITIGSGHTLRENELLSHPVSGHLRLKYYQIKIQPLSTVRVYSDCDESLTNQTALLPVPTYNTIAHVVSKGSIYTRTWMIRKSFSTQIIQFKITTDLLHNPDCEWEGITIYRGACPSWRKIIAVYCGQIEEFVSETTHSVVIIQFHTKADLSTESTFYGNPRRSFNIQYRVYNTGEDEEKGGIDIGLTVAVVISVIVIAIVVVLVFFLQIAKKKARRVATKRITLDYPDQKVGQSQQTQAQTEIRDQPMKLQINIDNAGQMAGVPNVLYDGGAVNASVNYTGIPPPAVYLPPSFPHHHQQHPNCSAFKLSLSHTAKS